MLEAGEIVPRPKLTYSVPEAARVLGISETKMYQLVKTRGFPTIRIGRRSLVSVKGLERWVEEQAEKGWGVSWV